MIYDNDNDHNKSIDHQNGLHLTSIHPTTANGHLDALTQSHGRLDYDYEWRQQRWEGR